ncbi:MAG: type I-U CRISPR-associated protein Cas5/Cas6 [Deltaproteobacteria bacterium]|nr:type I-U CRISPR-associated protein Cas5/Cas6 [Deltaproteobacteria bacterium]
MLALRVEYLTGRSNSCEFNNRTKAEWPPHPARVFSALVSTWASEDQPSECERAALLWLAKEGAPSIVASDASRRDVVTHFVPDVPESLATRGKAAAGAKGRSATDTSKKPPSRTEMDRAVAILPSERGRQPRHFPSVTPDDPVVHFRWDADTPPEVRQALAALASRVVNIGHSSSIVRCQIVDETPEPNWLPDPLGGAFLRVPATGQLGELERSFKQHQGAWPRVLPCDFVRYQNQSPGDSVMPVHESVFSDELIVLRRVGGPRLPSTRAVDIASAVRGALLKHATESRAEVLSGHATDSAPSTRAHLAVVPLPWVAHPHADGSVLGVALVLPRSASDDERSVILRALAAWETAHRQDDEDPVVVPVQLGAVGVIELERVAWGIPSQTSLRATNWCGPSRRWMTVTPIALDRNPGELHAADPRKAKAAWRAAAETVARACSDVGLDLPERVTVLPSVTFAGSEKARAFPPFPPQEGRLRRVKVHACVEFAERVRGPLLLGAGRYLGLGLLRPAEEP